MCLAIPAKIESFVDEEKHFAVANISGVKRQVNVDLLKDDLLCVGDWVLIHVGFAMGKISEEQALEQLGTLARLGEIAKSEEEAKGYSFALETAEDSIGRDDSGQVKGFSSVPEKDQ